MEGEAALCGVLRNTEEGKRQRAEDEELERWKVEEVRGRYVCKSMTRKWTTLCGLGKQHSESTAE